jgi:hypothetical protein
MFRTVPLSIIRSILLFTQQWYMSYRFVDMFRTVPLSIIRGFTLYTQQWYMSYRFCWQLASGIVRKLSAKPVRHIPLLCVQWKTPDGGQRNCPKHVEFYSKNKFENSVHLVCFYYKNCSLRQGSDGKHSLLVRTRDGYNCNETEW